MQTATETLIIGAGLSGLAAARVLAHGGQSAVVVDKGRGVGGRLATRRIGDATLDHGAQFFTVRGDDFRAVVDEAAAANVVDVWCHGFDSEDGYPRFYCPAGMTALAKHLATDLDERGVTITKGAQVTAIEETRTGWRLQFDSDTELNANNLIVTAPVPQTLALLDAGSVQLEPELRSTLNTITYKPTMALLVTLDGPSAVPPPGGIQNTEDDLFTFITDNQMKGVSASPALTFHVNGAVSSSRWDDNRALVIAELLEAAEPFIGGAPIIDVQLHAWKYAGPHVPHPDRVVTARQTPGSLLLAGDAFGGPKVEGAFNSGTAAGRALLAG